MPDRPENHGAETEKGFGTGLRAQLQRRRDGEEDQAEAPGQTNVELRLELTARPAGDTFEPTVNSDVEALRAELEASKEREASLHDALNERSQAYEQNVGSEKQLAQRAATLDEREAKLAEFEVAKRSRPSMGASPTSRPSWPRSRRSRPIASSRPRRGSATSRAPTATARRRRRSCGSSRPPSPTGSGSWPRKRTSSPPASRRRRSASRAANGRSRSARTNGGRGTRSSPNESAGWPRARPT